MAETAQQPEKKGLPPALQAMLRTMSGDMKFIGIFTIVAGAISCLSIIGAAFGIPYIFAGIRLKDSAAAFVAYSSHADSGQLRNALDLQGKYFRIQKILILVGLGLAALYIIVAFFIIGMALSG